MNEVVSECIPRYGEYDPLADEGAEAAARGRNVEPMAEVAETESNSAAIVPVVRVMTLTEMLSYEQPVGSMLVGDGVIEYGGITLLYGPPGSFKGFAVGHLMACGAWGHGEWLGHPVTAKFASLWLNCENGPRRLRDQFCKMNLPPDAEQFIHVTDIPAIWNLADVRLAGEIRRTIVEKNIRVLIIDTVSNFTEDEFAKQFAIFFASLNSLLYGLDPKPAVLLIHHARKPKESDKGARGLLNLISGHQTLQRRARSICYLSRVTDEFDEKRIVAVWLKVSDSGTAEGRNTALKLASDATLVKIENFDWSEWEGGASGGTRHEPKVREEHLRELFEDGRRRLAVKEAVDQLKELAGVGRSAAYEALKVFGGRFSSILSKDTAGLLCLRGMCPSADANGDDEASSDAKDSTDESL